jgi:hypothetical protein
MSSTGLRRFAAPGQQQETVPGEDTAPREGVPGEDTASRADTAFGEDTVPREGFGPQAGPQETCEFCAASIPAGHAHVADIDGGSLMCACRACYLLFTHSQAGHGRYKSIPDRHLSDPDHPLSAADWETLQIPVGLAFFLRSSASDETRAFYPSPAGVTECQLNLDAWASMAAGHPLLAAAEPDVEAVLIARTTAAEAGGAALAGTAAEAGSVDAFLLPVDSCYELAGRMRLLWRGFDGGAEARQSINEFLARARQRSRALGGGRS